MQPNHLIMSTLLKRYNITELADALLDRLQDMRVEGEWLGFNVGHTNPVT